MKDFTAIDFETAQGYRWSICQVGLVRVENGIITDELNLLVRPPDNYYWGKFINIHGITPKMTAHAPTFAEVWHQVQPFIENQAVVAHNGINFDFPVLSATLQYYGLSTPKYEKHCTYRIYRSGLAALCNSYNIPLHHHDALSDAKACAELFKMYLGRR